MRELNLVDLEKSDIKYQISQFPDGQQSVTLTNQFAHIISGADLITIKTRLNSFKDLEILICATQAIRNVTSLPISLYVPYFLGSRSDRKFVEGGVNYLKQVICPIINSLNFTSVVVLDPHSDVLEACLNNYEKVDNHIIVRYALEHMHGTVNSPLDYNVCLVSPDAGAYKKIFDVAQSLEIENIITATKVRDLKTGQILHTEIPTLDQHNKLRYVIVDDICDGGRTFIELAKAIKGSRPTAEIYLIVTHGIFSAGYDQLEEYFEQIYTTNSYKDIDHSFVTQFNVF
jgi:ribose-phosphate pyrophosphokinase